MYFFSAGSEQQVEQTVDFQFAQTELMMNEISSGIECLVCVSVSDLTWGAFQKSELAAGLWPDQSFWQWSGLFPRAFAEKPPPSCILFRIWQIYWRILMEWSGRPVLTNGKHPEISCLGTVIAIPGIEKKKNLNSSLSFRQSALTFCLQRPLPVFLS